MGLIRRIRVTQQATETAMLGVSLRDQIGNEEIRRRTRVTAIVREADVARGGTLSSENRWTLWSQGVGMPTPHSDNLRCELWKELEPGESLRDQKLGDP
ncbi:jg13210 [Pararge aegeria aegeria]|uniref:Jg13210 protein n=1 Tax=Pararge aegeria aegeria TaxID=348720 RepID=A0A8S4RDE9_9NEOP|nr:jg13210 [Pararge aegeria aegeria]